MAGIIWVRTCNSCGFNNPGDSNTCNKCGTKLYVAASFPRLSDTHNYTRRWACPTCRSLNMSDNMTCFSCGFKRQKESGGCFITTATLISIGKGENSQELNMFRDFRDSWLEVKHPKLIEEYYKVAPSIVSAIDAMENAKEIYSEIWKDCIFPCLTLLREGRNEDVFEKYKSSMELLKKVFLD